MVFWRESIRSAEMHALPKGMRVTLDTADNNKNVRGPLCSRRCANLPQVRDIDTKPTHGVLCHRILSGPARPAADRTHHILVFSPRFPILSLAISWKCLLLRPHCVPQPPATPCHPCADSHLQFAGIYEAPFARISDSSLYLTFHMIFGTKYWSV